MASNVIYIVPAGSGGQSAKDLVISLKDEFGNAINLTGATVRLTGKSQDLPAKTLNVVGAVTDGAQGVCTWAGVGNETAYVSITDMAGRREALFTCQIKYEDAASEEDFGPIFELIWAVPVISW